MEKVNECPLVYIYFLLSEILHCNWRLGHFMINPHTSERGPCGPRSFSIRASKVNIRMVHTKVFGVRADPGGGKSVSFFAW